MSDRSTFMVTDKPAYKELMEYLASSLGTFELKEAPLYDDKTVEMLVEQEITTQVITLCSQHEELETNHRSIIVREIDSIVYDMHQVLLTYWERPVTQTQALFIVEFTGLIKNVFDSAVADLLD